MPKLNFSATHRLCSKIKKAWLFATQMLSISASEIQAVVGADEIAAVSAEIVFILHRKIPPV